MDDGGCSDCTSWCIAEDGDIVRFYNHDFQDGEHKYGRPHPAENGLRPVDEPVSDWLRDHGFPPELWDIRTLPDPDMEPELWQAQLDRLLRETNLPPLRAAMNVAARASAGPYGWGPHNRVEGQGVLALTACERRYGHRGALPI